MPITKNSLGFGDWLQSRTLNKARSVRKLYEELIEERPDDAELKKGLMEVVSIEKQLAQVEELERSLKEPSLNDFEVIPHIDLVLKADASPIQVDADFRRAAMFLDLVLEPDAAEDTIGDLEELYARRLAANPAHAKRWLLAQVLWIIFGRAMDVFGRFTKARAGK